MAQQGRVAKSKLVDGLTPKQAKFVQGVAEGKSARDAAMEAYKPKNLSTAAVIASENQNKPNVKEAIAKALEHHAITPEMAIEPVKRALLYQGDNDRESLEMNLKGVDRYARLIAMTEDKDTDKGGNTFIINTEKSQQFFRK